MVIGLHLEHFEIVARGSLQIAQQRVDDGELPAGGGPGCDYTLDVSGGWYDAGDHGKYVVNGGISVWLCDTGAQKCEREPGSENASVPSFSSCSATSAFAVMLPSLNSRFRRKIAFSMAPSWAPCRRS